MTYNKETALTENTGFTLPAITGGEFSTDDISEDYDGLQMSFQRIKIPGGGSLVFEKTGDDPEHPEYVQTIEGIILFNHQASAYWPEGSEYDDSVSPMCSSVDGKIGYGLPGGACALCEFNKYGTGVDAKGNPSRGKACKNMRNLYILQDGEYMPILLSLPPTSIRPFTEFMSLAFVPHRRPTWASVVQIGLKRVENGSNLYSVATFKKLFDFTGEQLQQVRSLANGFREQIKLMLQQRADVTETRNESEDLYEAGVSYSDTGSDGHFCIQSNEIDGDREELPA